MTYMVSGSAAPIQLVYGQSDRTQNLVELSTRSMVSFKCHIINFMVIYNTDFRDQSCKEKEKKNFYINFKKSCGSISTVRGYYDTTTLDVLNVERSSIFI